MKIKQNPYAFILISSLIAAFLMLICAGVIRDPTYSEIRTALYSSSGVVVGFAFGGLMGLVQTSQENKKYQKILDRLDAITIRGIGDSDSPDALAKRVDAIERKLENIRKVLESDQTCNEGLTKTHTNDCKGQSRVTQ